MDRIAALLKAARDLQRRLWCSLPFGYRLAHLLCALSSSALEAYGKAFYTAFLQKGVTGMPDIFNKPAEQWFAEQPENIRDTPKLADKLPKDYGYDLANLVKKILLRKFGDPGLVDEALSGFYMRYLASGHLRFTRGTSLADAHRFVIESVKRELINLLKSRGRKREQSLFQEDEGEERTIDIRDPNAFEHLEDTFPDWHQPVVKRDLMRVAPWVPAYLDLATEGYGDDEIFGWSKSDPYSGSKPSELAKRLGLDFVPRPGSKDPLGRGLWSKPGTGTKNKIVEVLNSHIARD